MFEDILSCRIATFTVDTAAANVDVVPDAGIPIMKTPFGDYKIRPEDNCLLQSVAIVLPYCFSQGDDRASVDLAYVEPSTPTAWPITEFGAAGKVWLFSENVDLSLDTFWKWSQFTLTGETHSYFSATTSAHINPADSGTSLMNISMVNAPDILDETVQPVFCFLKILHTLTLFQ